MTRCTVLGSCRQYTLRNFLTCDELQEAITYPHYSKEALQMAQFALTNHMESSIASQLFRTPLVEHKPMMYKPEWKTSITEADIVFVEIASKEERFFAHPSIREKIHVRDQTKEEIREDLLALRALLEEKHMVVVTHYSSYERGKRYELVCWLEEICEECNIPCINPKKELATYDAWNLWVREPVLSHYTAFGEQQIEQVYRRVVNKILGTNY